MAEIICKHRPLKTVAALTVQWMIPGFIVSLGIALPFYTPNKGFGTLFGALLVLLGIGFFYKFSFGDYHWVALRGEKIVGKRFYTRQIVQRSVHDIEAIVGYGTVVESAASVAADQTLGRLRGFQINFQDGLSIPLGRVDMRDADLLVATLIRQFGIPLHPPDHKP